MCLEIVVFYNDTATNENKPYGHTLSLHDARPIYKMEAPRVVAKGADLMAKRIREIATEHKVPIVENPPLARALFKVEIDDPIPFELYRTVAEVISYIMRLKQGIQAQYEPSKEPIPEIGRAHV